MLVKDDTMIQYFSINDNKLQISDLLSLHYCYIRDDIDLKCKGSR